MWNWAYMGLRLLTTLMWANIFPDPDPAPKFANKYPSRERRKRVIRVFEIAKISQESENEKLNADRIEDVSRDVHAKTRQRSCFEAASCACCFLRSVGCCYSGRSLCSPLLFWQQRRARSRFLVFVHQLAAWLLEVITQNPHSICLDFMLIYGFQAVKIVIFPVF